MGYRWQNSVRAMDKRGQCSGYWNVLGAIASYAPNETGICSASIATIAEGTGLSSKQVRRHKQKAIALGHVLLVGNERGGKPGTTQHLQMNIPAEKTLPMGGSRTPPLGVQHASHAMAMTAPVDGSQKKGIKRVKEYISDANNANFRKPDIPPKEMTYAGYAALGEEHGVYKDLYDTDYSYIEKVRRASFKRDAGRSTNHLAG